MEDQIFQFDQKYILHPLPLRLELDKADPEVQKVELLDYYFQSQELNFPVIAILFDLNNIQFDQLSFSFKDSNSSCLVTIPNNEDYKYVVMPMRI